jgi:hypothetical protein
MMVVKNILSIYEAASGQTVNLQKNCAIFANNLGVRQVLKQG